MNRTQVCVVASQDGRVEIRPASSGDADALRAFLVGLSLRTRYLRFFAGGASASPAMVAVLMGGRDNTDAVVATQDGTIIGHAMATDTTSPAGAHAIEIGVAVSDAQQGRGIGSELVREVTGRAQTRGATTVTMEVLAENRKVLSMIARRWPDACHTRSGPYVTVHAQLSAPARAAVPAPRRCEPQPVLPDSRPCPEPAQA